MVIKSSVIVRLCYSMEESQLGDNDQVQVGEDSVARQPLSQPWCTVHPSYFIQLLYCGFGRYSLIELSCYNGESNESGQYKESGHALHPSILKKA